MTEQKKIDSQIENAANVAPNAEKSANAIKNPEKSAEILSEDELNAVSGGNSGTLRTTAILNCDF